MARYRVPSPTPSVGSDAPIPETLQEDPIEPQILPGIRPLSKADMQTVKNSDKECWVIFVGNLHPHVVEADLHNLFGGRHNLGNITIRTTRGCGMISIPEEDIGLSDRCYASVGIIGRRRALKILGDYSSRHPPLIRGLPVVLGLSPGHLPDLREIMMRTLGYVPGEKKSKKPKKSGKSKKFIKSQKSKCTEKPIRRQIAVQRTEKFEDQTMPLAGPSRNAQPKPR